jgi:alginate O-acetyltransferase complex protein AlgJ
MPFIAEVATGGAAGGIFATDAPMVGTYLVGTSYSANANWSFTPALMTALRRDILNFAEQGRGPVRPMRAMLDDPNLAESPPELVLWEFPIRYLGDPSIWPDDLRADAGPGPQGSL